MKSSFLERLRPQRVFVMRNALIRLVGQTGARRVAPALRAGQRALGRTVYRGSARHCVCCGSDLRRFLDHGLARRTNARCPACGSLERHRLLWLFLQRERLLTGGRARLLHLAPERQVGDLLSRAPKVDYLSADIDPGAAMVVMDVTAIDQPAGSFDVIVCSHVLEHVPDDTIAMNELARVLDAGGVAIFQVPTGDGSTDEDPQVTDPTERLRRFGQDDHVRVYGSDGVFESRLSDAGFDVEVVDRRGLCTDDEGTRLGIPDGEQLFVCRKRVA